MEKIMTFMRRYLLFSKRLFLKPSFVVILLLVPIMVLALSLVSQGSESGVLTISLAMQDDKDPVANEIVSKLVDDDGIIRFVLCDSVSLAHDSVVNGESDAAWIFAADIESRAEKFASHTSPHNAFVKVIQKEENVILRLSHEKLNTLLYPYISLANYKNYIYYDVVSIDALSPEELEEYYYSINAEGADLFEFVYANQDNSKPQDGAKSDYLVSPMRGLMAIMVLLCGLAVAMFYMQDEERGTFDRIPYRSRFAFSVSYHFTAVISTAFVMLLTILMTGMKTTVLNEMLVLLLYCVTTVGFCIGVRLVFRDIRWLGVASPILVVVATVICPVFINLDSLSIVQHLLPTYYYLKAVYFRDYIYYMMAYAVAVFGFDYIVYRLKRQ